MKQNLEVRAVIQPNMFREGDKYYIIFQTDDNRHTINFGKKTYEAIEAMLTEVLLNKEDEEIKNSIPVEGVLQNAGKTINIIRDETVKLEQEMKEAKKRK